MKPLPQPTILMWGNDLTLEYLIGRYAQQSGYEIVTVPSVPSAEEVCSLKPIAILFTSIESLEAAQSQNTGLVNYDIPILVCSSIADEARARELGADYCLLHPLTYNGFREVFTASGMAGRIERW